MNDLHQLSPGIIVDQISGFIPVFLSKSCWADLLIEMRSLWHLPLNPDTRSKPSF
jgi:hypothetical protein